MQELPNAMNVLAPDCGSWGIPCRGTSKRSWINYEGAVQYPFVRVGNMMVSRFFRCIFQNSRSYMYIKKTYIYIYFIMPTEADSALLGGAGTEGYLYHREPPGNIDLQTRPV